MMFKMKFCCEAKTKEKQILNAIKNTFKAQKECEKSLLHELSNRVGGVLRKTNKHGRLSDSVLHQKSISVELCGGNLFANFVNY